MDIKDIATSPIFYCGPGMASRAVVLRVMLNEAGTATKFIVHDRYTYQNMSPSYGSGDYYHGQNAFQRAYRQWIARSNSLFEQFPLAVSQGGLGADGFAAQ